MTFLAEMNNKRDMIFWNIKINRVIIPTHEQRVLGLVTETRKRQNVKCWEKYLAKNGNVDFFVMTLQMSCGAFRQRERVTLQTFYGAERAK